MRAAAALLKDNQEENEGLKKAQRRWTHIKPDFATRGIYGVVFHRGPIDGRHIQHNAALSFNGALPQENCYHLRLQEQTRGGQINHHSPIFNECYIFWSVTKSECKSLTWKSLLESWNEIGLSMLSPQCWLLYWPYTSINRLKVLGFWMTDSWSIIQALHCDPKKNRKHECVPP